MVVADWPCPGESSHRQVLRELRAPLEYIEECRRELVGQQYLEIVPMLVMKILRYRAHQPGAISQYQSSELICKAKCANLQDMMRKARYSPRPSWGSYVYRSTCICTYKNHQLHSLCY